VSQSPQRKPSGRPETLLRCLTRSGRGQKVVCHHPSTIVHPAPSAAEAKYPHLSPFCAPADTFKARLNCKNRVLLRPRRVSSNPVVPLPTLSVPRSLRVTSTINFDLVSSRHLWPEVPESPDLRQSPSCQHTNYY
jgi:hypothetical protein